MDPKPPITELPRPTESEFARQKAARTRQRQEFWDQLAPRRDDWRRRGSAYHDEIIRLLRFLIPPGHRVLEIGTTTGDLLARLEPSFGMGIDLSPRMIECARQKHPHLTFVTGNAEDLPEEVHGQTFDFIVMSDLVGHLEDVWLAFRQARTLAHSQTRLVVTWYNFLWEPLLKLGEKIGLKMPVNDENWLSLNDLDGLLSLNHFDVVQHGSRMLIPRNVPLLAPFANSFLSPLPGIRHLNLIEYLVARPIPQPPPEPLTTSVIVPCRNEAGNIRDAVSRLPQLGPKMEIIFCDGHSTDGTVEVIQQVRAETNRGDREVRLIHQEGRGKGGAVRQAFDAAQNDVLFILDADLTVAGWFPCETFPFVEDSVTRTPRIRPS